MKSKRHGFKRPITMVQQRDRRLLLSSHRISTFPLLKTLTNIGLFDGVLLIIALEFWTNFQFSPIKFIISRKFILSKRLSINSSILIPNLIANTKNFP